MRKLAIVLLGLGVFAGYGSALGHMRHHRAHYGEGCRWGSERYSRTGPDGWEPTGLPSRVAAPAAPAPAPAPAAAPAPSPVPQIIIVQSPPAQASQAPVTVVVPGVAGTTPLVLPSVPAAAAPVSPSPEAPTGTPR